MPSPLDKVVEDARRSWPDIALDEQVFRTFVTEKGGDLSRLHAADLYLACACSRGDAHAIARFEEHQALVHELKEARRGLEARKTIERAKGLVMERRGFSEEQAYAAMRRMAMERNMKLHDLARQILAMKDLL